MPGLGLATCLHNAPFQRSISVRSVRVPLSWYEPTAHAVAVPGIAATSANTWECPGRGIGSEAKKPPQFGMWATPTTSSGAPGGGAALHAEAVPAERTIANV